MSNYKLWAPKCALPDCTNHVRYHDKGIKQDGTPWFKWKTFCDYHRSVKGKKMVEELYKKREGCENRDARLGFKCPNPTTPSLTIDHWDGDRHNSHQDNLVVLCANCHAQKTKLFKDNLNRYNYTSTNFNNLFEIT